MSAETMSSQLLNLDGTISVCSHVAIMNDLIFTTLKNIDVKFKVYR